MSRSLDSLFLEWQLRAIDYSLGREGCLPADPLSPEDRLWGRLASEAKARYFEARRRASQVVQPVLFA